MHSMEWLTVGLLITALLLLVYLSLRKTSVEIDLSAISELLTENQEKAERKLGEQMTMSRQELAASEKRLREELTGLFKGFSDSLDKRIGDFSVSQSKNFEIFSAKLTELTDRNDIKMDKVKEAVEKRLEEIQTIAVGVGDLKKVLSNIKTRGTWGEAQLGNLIAEILTTEQYDINVKTKKGSAEAVEFGIKLPGQGDEIKHVWLPIDAKFPLEDYKRLIEAQEKGDLEAVQISVKALEMRVKGEAKYIKEKYINPPYTTDFGILFLPVESLYAEVLRIPGLAEQIRREFKVIVTGPTTIQAILNSLQMGFKTLAIQKRSSEVWDVLGKVKTEFGNFGLLLEKTHKKLQEASTTMESAAAKTRNIQSKLSKVQELPAAASESDTISLPIPSGETAKAE